MNPSTTTDDTFTVGDRRKRRQQERDDLVMKNYSGEFERYKNLIGPSFVACGVYGFFHGIVEGARTIQRANRPFRLIMTSYINVVGKQTSRFANAGGALCLLYSMTRKIINFSLEEELQELNNTQRQAIYGFVTGALFKSTRGLLPSMFSAVLISSFCASFSYFYEKGSFGKWL